MAVNRDLELIRGDSKTFKVTINKGSVPVDLSNDLLFFTIKDLSDTSTDDSSAQLAKKVTVPSGADASNGIAYLTLTKDDMAIPAGQYKYDLQWVDPGTTPETVTTLIYGKMKIVDDVTKGTT